MNFLMLFFVVSSDKHQIPLRPTVYGLNTKINSFKD